MKKMLTKGYSKIFYYYEDENRIYGAPPSVSGNLSGISGDLSRISGNLDLCEITDEERKAGINIEELIIDDN
jgi:hypothetical protein